MSNADREALFREADRRVEQLRDQAAALVRAKLGPSPREREVISAAMAKDAPQ